MGDPARMFVAAMEEYECTAYRLLRRRPMPIKQIDVIVRAKRGLDHGTFCRQRRRDNIIHRMFSLGPINSP